MLHKISYLFPNKNDQEKDFCRNLLLLFGKLQNTVKSSDQLIIFPSYPKNSLPVTVVKSDSIPFPQVVFETEKEILLKMKYFYLTSRKDNSVKSETFNSHKDTVAKKDNIGSYIQLTAGSTQLFQLSLGEIHRRIGKHIVRIDHTGVNIPSAIINRNEWSQLIKNLSRECNIYNYPTGEDWPFVLPSTEEKFKNDITDFHMVRKPKFELVYDQYLSIPTIQFDIETDLIRKKVEELLPNPYGISFPDLADFFRTVYIYHPWGGLAIRFDIGFKNNDQKSDWETGEWLVKDGGRIKF